MFSGGFSELFSREPDAAAEISGCAQSLHVKGEASFRSWAQGFVLRLEAVNLPQIKSGMYLPVIEPHGAETRIFLPAVTVYNGYILCAAYCPTADTAMLRGREISLYAAVFTDGGFSLGEKAGGGYIF